MKLHRILLLLLALALRASGETPLTLDVGAPPPSAWIVPLDLSLGERTPLTAEQVYRSPFSIRCEVRQSTSPNGRIYFSYRWLVRNRLDQPLSLAAVRPPRPPINPQGLGKVYGATWANMEPWTLTTEVLYTVRTRDAAGWRRTDHRNFASWRDIQWLTLEAGQEREIHSAFTLDTPVEAATFSIPFQVDGFSGEAFLVSTAP